MADAVSLVLRSVYLPEEMDSQLRAIAFRERRSKGDLIRALLAEGLSRYPSFGVSDLSGDARAASLVERAAYASSIEAMARSAAGAAPPEATQSTTASGD